MSSQKQHPCVQSNKLILIIEELNHENANIHNIKDRTTKKPLTVFYIDIKHK